MFCKTKSTLFVLLFLCNDAGKGEAPAAAWNTALERRLLRCVLACLGVFFSSSSNPPTTPLSQDAKEQLYPAQFVQLGDGTQDGIEKMKG